MNFFYKIILAILLFFSVLVSLSADEIYFIDFSKVLNQSKAGAEAQEILKNKFKSESDKFIKQEESIKQEEKDLILQKKILTTEEYQKKITDLRIKVSNLQEARQKSLNSIAQSRTDAKKKLVDAVNPILKKYMEQNNIRIVIDKKDIILGDTNLEITNIIIEQLNTELKSIKIN